jgi:uncharacterized protein YpiB (UPF0302 family)
MYTKLIISTLLLIASLVLLIWGYIRRRTIKKKLKIELAQMKAENDILYSRAASADSEEELILLIDEALDIHNRMKTLKDKAMREL